MSKAQDPGRPAVSAIDNTLVERLCADPRAFDHPVRGPRLIETHISWIILTGEFAYKIKKPVDFGFLDFSTLAQRHFYCTEELRLNRRFSPGIYLDLVEIRGSREQPRLHGDGEAIEYAVKMREFPQRDLLSVCAEKDRLDAALVDEIADRVSAVHAECEVAAADSTYGSYAVVRHWAAENLTHLTEAVDEAILPAGFRRLCQWYRQNESIEAEIEARKAAGFVRECHGDLHLGNMALIDGRVTLFDCIEFNPELRWIDTISEVAFVAMDLHARGYPGFCWRFINRYLESGGDYAAMKLLRYYFVYRALVRAKVEALRVDQEMVDGATYRAHLQPAFDYIDLADRWAHGHRAGLIIMHGLSGSGKSTVAAELAERLGAIRLRSDVERKRLFDLDALADSGSALDRGIYSADASERTYRRLAELARSIVDADFSVIVDATFLRESQRRLLLELDSVCRFERVIVDCEAPLPELERRIVAREGDASEANLNVLHRQIETRNPLTAAERALRIGVGAEGLDDAAIERIRAALAK